MAYFDDISSIGKTHISQQTLQLYKLDGPRYGFYVNPTKTIILLSAEATLELAIAKKAKYCDILQIPHDSPNVIIHPDNDLNTRHTYGVRLLGCPFGTLEYCDKWLLDHYDDLRKCCQLVVDIPDSQLQWCFYHHILTKKVNHLLRCVSPSVLESYIQLVDSLLRKTFQHIIGVTVTDYIWNQVKTSVGAGGLGIIDTNTSALAAHAASCLEVLPSLNTVFASHLLPNTLWYHNLHNCVASLNQIATNVSITDYTSTKFHKPVLDLPSLQFQTLISLDKPRKLQYKFSTVMSACRDFIFLKSIPDEDDFNWFRIKSLFNPESGAFLTASLNADNTCTSEEFKAMLCDRLGIAQPCISPTTRCTCKTGAIIGVHGEHAHACAKGGERHDRHKGVSDHFCDMLAMTGVAIIKEPNDCFCLQDSKRRPDFQAKHLNRPGKKQNELFDISIVYPGSQQYLMEGSANTPGVAADIQFQHKSNIYSPLANNANFDFEGLIFESFGMFHEKAKELVNFCCTKMASKTGRPFAILKKYWTTRISVAVVRGTARMILSKYFDAVSSGISNRNCLDVLDRNQSTFASPFGGGLFGSDDFD